MTKDEISQFLNDHSEYQFDPILLQKLFSNLDVDDNNFITVEEFIKGYLQFEIDINKNNYEFKRRIIDDQNNYNNLEKKCLYKLEKISSEGFCENAKIIVEINYVVIQKQIEGINSIRIKVNYNDEIKEKNILINDINNNERFEFKPIFLRDKFEIYFIKVDKDNNEYEIESKRFPLDKITSQEKKIIKIIIPVIEDKDKAVAYINCKIGIFLNDYEFYESLYKK